MFERWRIPAKVFEIVSKTRRTMTVVAYFAPMNKVLHGLCICSREWCFQRTHSYCLDSLHTAFPQTRSLTAQRKALFGRKWNRMRFLRTDGHSVLESDPTLIIPREKRRRSSPSPRPLRVKQHSSCTDSSQPTLRKENEINNGARLGKLLFLLR